MSEADRALAEKAKASGTHFQSRDDAVRDFRARYAPTYTSTFAAEPAARPDYIPQSTVAGGQTINIFYHPGYHGYGYYYNGSWMFYDALADAMICDSLMHRHDYYYEPARTYYSGGYAGPAVVTNYGSSSLGAAAVLWFCLLLLALIFVIYLFVKRAQAGARRREQEMYDAARSSAPDGRPRFTTMAPPPPPPAHAESVDMGNPAFWQGVKIGTIITLNDELAMKDSMAKTGKAEGISYNVRGIRRIEEARGLSEWVMLHMQGNFRDFQNQHLWFVAKIVDDKLALSCYEAVKDLRPGNRKDFIDRGDLWLFQQPEDPAHVVYNRLKYTMDMTRDVDDGAGGETEIRYDQKPQGELQGTCVEEPAPSGMDRPMVATIIEYVTDQECDNPELLVVEIGSDDDAGGDITLMEGGPINPAEISVI